jgi:ubiquinone/menaquinone biosynthesis C-methylase UbiE
MTTDTTREARDEILAIAEAIAPRWERRRAEIEDLSGPVRKWLIRALAPQAGDTVLELAAGVGDTGFDAAAIIGPEGRLLCTDFSPGMLAAARRRGAERGAENVEYRILDAQRIALDADSVDGVLCRFGYMLMPDTAAALAETRRVLRPGGRLALAVWGSPERNPMFSIIAGNLIAGGHLPPPEPPPAAGIFSMASPERTSALLAEAGFGDVRTEEVPVQIAVDGIDGYIGMIADTAGPVGLAVQALDGREHERLRTNVEAACERFARADGYLFTGVAVCAVATA